MSDCTLTHAGSIQTITGIIATGGTGTPPLVAPPAINVRVTPPSAQPICLQTNALPPPTTIRLQQPIPRILLTVGPQIGRPGPAADRNSNSNPVFSYTNDQLTGIAYPDGSTKTLTYDASNRLSSLASTVANFTQTKTFHYDANNHLTHITLS